MKFQDLPYHWQAYIAKPNLKDFHGTVTLNFEDGSYSEFRYAFAAEWEEKEEICIFTEHCGHHLFSTCGLSISTNPTLP